MPATILLLTDSKSVQKILLETPTVINLTFKKFNFVAQCNLSHQFPVGLLSTVLCSQGKRVIICKFQ